MSGQTHSNIGYIMTLALNLSLLLPLKDNPKVNKTMSSSCKTSQTSHNTEIGSLLEPKHDEEDGNEPVFSSFFSLARSS